jgi:hypothetical protein
MKKHKIGALHTRAMFDPASLNESERTVEVTFATDTPVRMSSWMDGPYDEILSFEAGHVRWDRINSGAPLLNNHDRWAGVNGVLGIIERAWTDDNKKGRAIVRFSKREDVEPVFQDVRDGILKGISVGYRVHKYEVDNPERTKGEVPIYRAIDWEPFEISLAPIQVDVNSAVRSTSAELNEVEVVSFNSNHTMKRELIIAALKKRGISVQEDITDEELLATLERAMSADPTPAPATAPAPTPAPASAGEDTRSAVEAERKRSAEILKAVRAAKLGDEFATELIEGGKTLDQARAAIIEKWAENDPNKGTGNQSRASVQTDEADKRRAGMEDAIVFRSTPDAKGIADKIRGNEFRGMSLLRMAEESLNAVGVKTRGMSDREIATAALGIDNSRMYHSSSDFPIILGNTVNRTLRAAYDLQPRTFLPFCRRASAKDFRNMTKAQISGIVGNFDLIPEGAEYERKTLNEASESYRVFKYGQIIAITWETLINDDLDAFSRVPAAIAAKAAQRQSDIVWGILTSNPNMSDNQPLFSAPHGNLGTATAIVEAGINAARAAMRKQTSLEGDFINVQPQFMMVGPDKETEAQKLLQAVIVATRTQDTNVFRGFTDLIVEPRLTGNQWYLSANPSTIDTIEYAFLEGDGELFTEQKTGFDVDGVQIKARMVFGAKAIDWRGLYRNPGA